MIPTREHGGDGVRLAEVLGVAPSAVLDLSASMNPVAPDPAPVVGRHLDALGRYPDPAAATDALAGAIGVPARQLLLTNGGAEAIALVAAELGRGRVDEPDFGLYRRHLTVDARGPRWRSNPHNPSGKLAAPQEHADVWDEAFWPMATGTWTRGESRNGAIVLGSLTKLLACPGLRIGYVHARDEDLIDRLAHRQPRWAVNGLVCETLPELLAGVDLPGWSAAITALRRQLEGVLVRAGYPPRPSDANWLLVDAPGLRERLARRAILVRDCSSFGLPGTVRIAVPDERGLDRLQDAL